MSSSTHWLVMNRPETASHSSSDSNSTHSTSTETGRPVEGTHPSRSYPTAGGRPQGQTAGDAIEMSVTPETGWHVGHYFYRFRREVLTAAFDSGAKQAFHDALHPEGKDAPERLASYWISGHEADFGIMVMDPLPSKVDGVHQALQAPGLGHLIEPAWSFVSLSEVSEYVPTVEQFRESQLREGVPPGEALEERVAGYERRLPMMNRQRLEPEFPDWPSACFYPMNKSRAVGSNWFTEPFSLRRSMMSEHARSGMGFMGKVSQLISVGVGLDDWEWMVTLWGKNPQYLKDIVYQMRFDEASAKYAEFGPFYVGYKSDAAGILEHCRLA